MHTVLKNVESVRYMTSYSKKNTLKNPKVREKTILVVLILDMRKDVTTFVTVKFVV